MFTGEDFYIQKEVTDVCALSNGWFAYCNLKHGIKKFDVFWEGGGQETAEHLIYQKIRITGMPSLFPFIPDNKVFTVFNNFLSTVKVA